MIARWGDAVRSHFINLHGHGAAILSLLLVVTALWRMEIVVTAQPIIGFANNFDFTRQSSCVGIWENYGDRAKEARHPEGPVPRMMYDGDRKPDLCVRSIDNLLPFLAARFHRKNSELDLREIGLAKAFFATVAGALLLAQRMQPHARICVAGIFLLTVGDFETLSYANTLYLEFSVIVACMAALAACGLTIGRPVPPRWRDLWLPVTALAWLGLTKQQYGGLAACLGAVSAVIVLAQWRQPAKAALLLAVGLAAPLIFNAKNPPSRVVITSLDAANRTDTFLGAVLPAASDPDRALQTLGLPESCRAAIGQDWYTPDTTAKHACPQVSRLGRWQLPKLFVSQPATFIIPVSNAIRESQGPSWYDSARFEHKEDRNLPLYRAIEATSLTSLLNQLPPAAYKALVAGAMVAGVAALLAWLARLALAITSGPDHAAHPAYGQAWVGLGGFTALYAIVSSVFGDGYQDVQRHAVALPIALVFVAAGLLCWLYERYQKGQGSALAPSCRRRATHGGAVSPRPHFNSILGPMLFLDKDSVRVRPEQPT